MNLSSHQLFDQALIKSNYSAYRKIRGAITYRDKYKKFKKYQFNTMMFGLKYEKHLELNMNFDNPLYREVNTEDGIYLFYVSDIRIRFKHNHEKNYQYMRDKYIERYGSDDLFNDDMYYDVCLSLHSKFIDNENQVIDYSGLSGECSRKFKVFKLIYKNIFENSELIFNRYIKDAFEKKGVVEKEFNILDFIK